MCHQSWCRDGVVVRESDLQPRGRRFESRPLRSTYNPGQVVHTRMPLFTKQYKLVPAKLGAKQALHATHWPRVRGIATSAGVWLRAIETEISAVLPALVAREGLWI